MKRWFRKNWLAIFIAFMVLSSLVNLRKINNNHTETLPDRKKAKGKVGKVLSFVFAGIVFINIVAVIVLAVMMPLSVDYTRNDQYYYICSVSAGFLALIVAFLGARTA